MYIWRGLKRGFAALALCVALVVPAISPAVALEFPQLSGRVVDEAQILDTATRVDLIRQLALLEGKSTDQLVVVTLKSLQGTSIEDFGVQLGRHWKIGQAGKNNGVLLIVAPTERKVRIEVGYGLEGTLTDAVAKFIIESSILPRFKAGDFPGGIKRGTDDIIQVLTGDAEDWKRRAAPAAPSAVVGFLETVGGFFALTLFAGVFVVFFVVIGSVILAILVQIGVALGLIPPRAKRKGSWTYLNWIDKPSSSSGSSSSSSSSSSGFSGGGGSFGGGGSSGSW